MLQDKSSDKRPKPRDFMSSGQSHVACGSCLPAPNRMHDALRPDNETYKHYYEVGYRVWYQLYLTAVASPLDITSLDIENAFPQHPHFPPQLELNRNSSAVLYVTGTSSWETAKGDCDLGPLQMSLAFGVTITCPITVSLETCSLLSGIVCLGVFPNSSELYS